MRAHEKMLLNSKLMQATPFMRHCGKGVGCALGMIEGAELTESKSSGPESAEELYPWLTNFIEQPCNCVLPQTWEWQWTGIIAITHLFNEHVCRDIKGILPHKFSDAEPWTMEQLADYIKSIDPTVDQDALLCEQEVNEYQEASFNG